MEATQRNGLTVLGPSWHSAVELERLGRDAHSNAATTNGRPPPVSIPAYIARVGHGLSKAFDASVGAGCCVLSEERFVTHVWRASVRVRFSFFCCRCRRRRRRRRRRYCVVLVKMSANRNQLNGR